MRSLGRIAPQDPEDVRRVDSEDSSERVIERHPSLVSRDDGCMSLSYKADVEDPSSEEVTFALSEEG